MTQPIRTSKRVDVTRPSVPGGPAGNELSTLMAKSFVKSRTAMACPRCKNVSEIFYLRTFASVSEVTPVATTVLVDDMYFSLAICS
jgi:hypothetical protein